MSYRGYFGLMEKKMELLYYNYYIIIGFRGLDNYLYYGSIFLV